MADQDRSFFDQMRRLNRWALQSAARELVPDQRVAWCLRRLGFNPETRKQYPDVWVMFAERMKRAHYKHLFVCGSVWMCPLCAAKISERRRVELSQALENSDFSFALVSLTLQHSGGDKLKDSLEVLLHARHRLKNGREWKDFCCKFGIVGTISALESTYGVNGHHPHSHNLLVSRVPLDAAAVHAFIFPRWLAGLLEHGKLATSERGVHVRTAKSDVADYVAKWGHEPRNLKRPNGWTIEHELTKSVSKMSRGDQGFTPLDLLQAFNAGDDRAGEVWQEYAVTFKGRHQLQWSRGLRELLGLGRIESDVEIAARADEPAVLLAALTRAQWNVILGNDARGEVLEIASSGDVEQLQKFLSEIGVE